MSYPFITLDDNTEITHSELLSDGSVKVTVERPVLRDFHSATCIFKKITTGQFNDKSISTIGRDRRTLFFEINTNKEGEPEKKGNCEIQLWDTAGQERFRSITKTYYSSSQGLVFIYDITKRETFDNLDEWINNAKESLGNENNYLIFLIGNKLDLAEENPDKREVTVEEGESKCKENGIIWGGECSAKSYTEEKLPEDRIIINTAEISEDADEDGNPIDDEDSIPDNNEPDEDDIDIEKVRVKYFDLSLLKYVIKVIVTEDGKTKVKD